MKTPRIRNILVPIDFSQMSIQAIETAKAFAQRFGATIHLAHVHEFYCPAGFSAPMPPVIPYSTYAYDREAEKRAAQELNLLAKKHDLSPSTAHLLTGAPVFAEICRLARELPADLIVAPTHGHTGVKHVFLGSTAERIVQHSPCPVLVSRQPKRQSKNGAHASINTILVPVDYSKCSLAGLRYAIEFAKKVAARLIVLHVVDLGPQLMTDGYGMYDLSPYKEAAVRASEPRMRAFLRGVNFGSVPFETSAAAEFCPEGIYRAAEKEKVDIIILSTHGRTGLKHILIGSVAERVVRRASCPVLVVPSHPEMRNAQLIRQPRRVRKTRSTKIPRALFPRETFTRKYRKLGVNSFPERRKTNKFRETHVLK
jgi:nucleotide-binding universal stress UspA family protein